MYAFKFSVRLLYLIIYNITRILYCMSKFIIYSDFDGTITTYDTLDKIITDVYSYATYKEAERALIANEMTFENYLVMFSGIRYDIHQLSGAVDTHFKDFYTWIQKNQIDFYIISAGFKTIIRHLLPYVNDDIIYGNDINEDWKVKLFDEVNGASIQKNDIIQLHNKPTYQSIYIGDGLSDFKVVGKVDILFCKQNSLLHHKCLQENHDHIAFTHFGEVLDKITRMYASEV